MVDFPEHFNLFFTLENTYNRDWLVYKFIVTIKFGFLEKFPQIYYSKFSGNTPSGTITIPNKKWYGKIMGYQSTYEDKNCFHMYM